MVDVSNLITDHLDVWSESIKKKNATGRGSSKKVELYGIKKLRGLILDLAVRGKLVTQESKDEPASILLKKIAAEKKELIIAGQIKKQKQFLTVADDEMPYDLPVGWEWARLGVVCKKVTDGSHNPPRNSGSGYPMLSSQNVNYEKIDFTSPSRYVTEEDFLKEDKRTSIKPYDVLLNIVASIGRSAVVPLDAPKFVLQRSVAVLTPFLDPYYFAKMLVSPLCLAYYDTHAKGTAQKGIYLGKLSLMPLAVPPVTEQLRINTKVDELMALCDELEKQQESSIEAHKLLVKTLLNTLTSSKDHKDFSDNWQRIADHFDTLFTTEDSIEEIKQTILQLAVMGKLVPQDPNDEPANQLLKKISVEKAKLVKEGKIRKQKSLSVISDEMTPFELPEGWAWSSLGNMSEIGPRNSLDDTLEVSFVPMSLITKNYTGEHGQKYKKWIDVKKGYTHFSNGDIAIAKITPCFENSKAVVFTNLKNGHGAGTTELHVARPIAGTIDPVYILLYLKSPMFLAEGKSKMTGTAGHKRVPKEYFSNNALPLPPLQEQIRIVNKVKEIMELCVRLKANMIKLQTTQQHLADALTEQAVA